VLSSLTKKDVESTCWTPNQFCLINAKQIRRLEYLLSVSDISLVLVRFESIFIPNFERSAVAPGKFFETCGHVTFIVEQLDFQPYLYIPSPSI
jgi:hypothetical protein